MLVNNAGILRDRMLANMSEAEWDAVIKVHLKGTAGPSHFAAAYWRDRSKAGEANVARIINTTSPSGIYGNIGQTNYGAAKAGIAAFTIIAADELARYGVTVNAIAPAALTRLTAGPRLAPRSATRPRRRMSPRGSPRSSPGWPARSPPASPAGCSTSSGDTLAVAEGWHRGPTVDRHPGPVRPSARSSSSSWPRPAPTPTCSAPTAPDRGNDMPINHDVVGAVGEPVELSWTSKDGLLYALGVGAGLDELAFTTENSIDLPQRLLPTQGVVISQGGSNVVSAIGPFNLAMLVHGEQAHHDPPRDPGRGHGHRR